MPTIDLDHRRQFLERGYTRFEGVLDAREVAAGAAALDRHLGPDAPLEVAGAWGRRRQLNTPAHYIPGLDSFAVHPKVLEIVSTMIDGPFYMWREPIGIVSFPGPCCGTGAAWEGHVDTADWQFGALADRTLEDMDGTFAKLWIAFSTVEPGGGAFTLVPGSHRVVAEAASDPALRERIPAKDFAAVPGLDGEPIEVLPRDGDVYLYHPLLLHSASDNTSEVTRKVALFNYLKVGDPVPAEEARAGIPKHFHPDHLAQMDEPMRRLIDPS